MHPHAPVVRLVFFFLMKTSLIRIDKQLPYAVQLELGGMMLGLMLCWPDLNSCSFKVLLSSYFLQESLFIFTSLLGEYILIDPTSVHYHITTVSRTLKYKYGGKHHKKQGQGSKLWNKWVKNWNIETIGEKYYAFHLAISRLTQLTFHNFHNQAQITVKSTAV